MFIDASKGFEKAGNQNYLRQPHVDKIIDSYRHHRAEPKHSYIATVAVVALNDYNLNISRYVSTSVDEEVIDLDEVNKKLVELAATIKEAREKHNGFLRELGLREIWN